MANVSREQRRITKERILEVASQLFTEHGFANTTVREIAAAAEISESSIFTYFESKDGLLLSIVVPKISNISRVVSLNTPWQALTDLMRIHFERIDTIDRRLLHEFLTVYFRAKYAGESELVQRMQTHDRHFFDGARAALNRFEIDEVDAAMEVITAIYVANFVAYATLPHMKLDEFLASAQRQFHFLLASRWDETQRPVSSFVTVLG